MMHAAGLRRAGSIVPMMDRSIPDACSWLTGSKAVMLMADCVELAAWPVAKLGNGALKPASVQAGLRLRRDGVGMVCLHATSGSSSLG